MKRDIFQAMADPTRRAILMMTAGQAMTPTAIADQFDSTRQAISKHIRILMESNLLRQEKIGREIYYHLEPAAIDELECWLEKFKSQWHNRFDQLDKLLININSKKHENKPIN